jgi:B12-binding domain/radical SAM domain protein
LKLVYDVVLIHPPANYDFRKKNLFPGPIAYTVGESTDQFMIPSIGMLSIADYLDRNGYNVLVDNLCERMIDNDQFDTEKYIRNLSARVYAIGLHWCVHSQGAIEIAKLCKKEHNDALVILGGLTATVFHEEIISKYEFVDIVIRGEAEKPFLLLMQALEQKKKLEVVPNLTFRDKKGKIKIVPLMEPVAELNEFNFTRLDLLKPQKAVFTPHMPSHWSVPICRGCVQNCIACGGSSYSYRKYLGRKAPAFRSPELIVEDIKKLTEMGVKIVFLYQDPRMGGQQYCSRLISALRNGKIRLLQLSMELFSPADEEYIKKLSEIDVPLTLTISPESGVDDVRRSHGRKYTNDELFKTVELCKKYGITLGIHSMIASANDTPQTIKETWKFWEKICTMNQELNDNAPAGYAFGPMILLDPGSLAFNHPKSYGYRLIFKNLEDYIKGLCLPAWHQWLSYETRFLDRDSIIKNIIDSIEHSINLREKFGLYSRSEAETEHLCFVDVNKLVVDVVNKAMTLDEDERLKELSSLKQYLNRNIPVLKNL